MLSHGSHQRRIRQYDPDFDLYKPAYEPTHDLCVFYFIFIYKEEGALYIHHAAQVKDVCAVPELSVRMYY
jgi:hypothetical protein